AHHQVAVAVAVDVGDHPGVGGGERGPLGEAAGRGQPDPGVVGHLLEGAEADDIVAAVAVQVPGDEGVVGPAVRGRRLSPLGGGGAATIEGAVQHAAPEGAVGLVEQQV